MTEGWGDVLPGLAREFDPDTSKQAALFVTAKATTARVRLMEAHALYARGLTDEEAATVAELDIHSEYATRCSELKSWGFLRDTGDRRDGAAGAARMVRAITPAGLRAVADRRRNAR